MSKMGQLFMEQDCFDEGYEQDRGNAWAAWMDELEQDYINAELRELAAEEI